MRVLVTAGNTQAPLDRVRCITNIFSGRTGTRIALIARERGHAVTLATSHPEVVGDLRPPAALLTDDWRLEHYRTFNDLRDLLDDALTGETYDAVLHTAAVSDYLAAGVYAPAPGTAFDSAAAAWTGDPRPRMEARDAEKVK